MSARYMEMSKEEEEEEAQGTAGHGRAGAKGSTADGVGLHSEKASCSSN